MLSENTSRELKHYLVATVAVAIVLVPMAVNATWAVANYVTGRAQQEALDHHKVALEKVTQKQEKSLEEVAASSRKVTEYLGQEIDEKNDARKRLDESIDLMLKLVEDGIHELKGWQANRVMPKLSSQKTTMTFGTDRQSKVVNIAVGDGKDPAAAWAPLPPFFSEYTLSDYQYFGDHAMVMRIMKVKALIEDYNGCLYHNNCYGVSISLNRIREQDYVDYESAAFQLRNADVVNQRLSGLLEALSDDVRHKRAKRQRVK